MDETKVLLWLQGLIGGNSDFEKAFQKRLHDSQHVLGADEQERARKEQSVFQEAVVQIARKIFSSNARAAFLERLESENLVSHDSEGFQLVSPDEYSIIRSMFSRTNEELNVEVSKRRGATGGFLCAPKSTRSMPEVGVTLEAQSQEILKKSEEIQNLETKSDELAEVELTYEKHYYPLVQAWAVQNDYKACEIIGGRLARQKWENPDLLHIECAVDPLTNFPLFELFSFEVKLNVEPYAVWQAAHYLGFSAESYVAFCKDEKQVRSKYDGKVFDLAVELGLGVLCFEQGSFKLLQSPRKNFPNSSRVHAAINDFKAHGDIGEAVVNIQRMAINAVLLEVGLKLKEGIS